MSCEKDASFPATKIASTQIMRLNIDKQPLIMLHEMIAAAAFKLQLLPAAARVWCYHARGGDPLGQA